MAYKKQTWVDDETVGTADRFNHMEAGIEEAGKTGGVSAGAVVGWTKEEIPEGYEEIMLPSDVPMGTIVDWEDNVEIPEGWEEVGKDIIVGVVRISDGTEFPANSTKWFTAPNKEGYATYVLKPILTGSYSDVYAAYIPHYDKNTFAIRNLSTTTAYTWVINCVILQVRGY